MELLEREILRVFKHAYQSAAKVKEKEEGMMRVQEARVVIKWLR